MKVQGFGPSMYGDVDFRHERSLASVATTDSRVPYLDIKQDIEMEPIKFTLCPLCTECPEVEITDEGVRIGEDANTVRLSHAEWNELVALIKRGDLHVV